MNESAIKLTLAAFGAALLTYANQMIIPIIILGVAMLVDYLTGVHAAWVHKQMSSRVGFLGFLKKLSYLALVTVACLIDYLLTEMSARLGLEITVRFIGLLVVFWLIVNECISILENIAKIGTPMPPFIETLLQHLQHKVEDALPELPKEPAAEYQGKHFKQADPPAPSSVTYEIEFSDGISVEDPGSGGGEQDG